MGKKENNENAVNNIDYNNFIFDDYDEIEQPKIATIEYHNNSIVYEDYTKLDSYLKNVFIPNNLNKITIKDSCDNDYYFSISLSSIKELKLSRRELLYVVNYLKNEGIVIRGFSLMVDFDNENYECLKISKNYYNEEKYEKNNEEEIKLFELLRKNNDKKIREKIIIDNIRLVQYLASKFSLKYKLDVNELESYGFEYLCKAVDKFDYSKGYSFSTYAVPVIENGLKNGAADICNKSGNSTLRNYYYKVKPYISRVEKEEEKKIAEDYSLVEKVLKLMIEDGRINSNQRNLIKNYIYSYFDLLLDIENTDILLDGDFENTINEIYNDQLKEFVEKTLSEILNEKQKEVIKKRFGLYGGNAKTQEQIGREMSVTRERVRQIEERAFEKLKTKQSKEKFLLFLEGTIDSMYYKELYNYLDEDDYTNDIYDESYDYKKAPRR